MRFLIEYSDGGSVSVRSGWIRVLRALGHDAQFWNPQLTSAFDAFNKFGPDVFLGCSYNVDDAIEKCIRSRPALRVGLFGSAWGPLADALPAHEFPIVRVSEDEKRRLERLKKDTGNPQFVFIHATGPYLEASMSGWREIGIEPIGVLNAADIYVYKPGVFTPGLACDACFVGGKWPYKSRKLDPYIFPLISSDLNVKIFGRNHWQVPQYLGTISQENECNLYSTATVCLNVSEPHSTDERYGCDIIERVFKVLACGGFLVTDYVPEMELVFPPGCFEDTDSPVHFLELVTHYVQHPQERLPLIRAGYSFVLNHHTYHHRVAQLLEGLGLHSEADKCLQLLKTMS